MTKPVYVVYGPDAFLRSEAVQRIIASELGGAEPALGATRVDGDRAGLAEALDEVRTFSLLGDRRVVVVEQAEGFISKHRVALERYCDAPSDGGCLILCCERFDARTRLFKAVQAVGEVVKCETPRGAALLGWIANRAREKYGKTVAPPCAARLRELVGDRAGGLDSELSKLAVYVGAKGEIEVADVEALVGHHREETVFAVLDAIASGDPAGALRHWEQVVATDRAAPARAIGGLAWGVRRLLDAKRAVAGGTPATQVARQLWVDPRVLKQRLDRVTIEQLEDRLSDLLAADLASKTGLGTVSSAVEKFIVKHAINDRGGRKAASGGSR